MRDLRPSFARTATLLACLALAACATPKEPVGPNRCQPRPAGAQCITQAPRPLGLLLDNSPVTVQVDARCEWNPSGVILQRGARYHVAVTRVLETWADKKPVMGLAGRYTQRWARAPELPMDALVGSEGRDGRTLFLAGPESTFTAQRGDELLFFANDWPGRTADNRGCVELEIRQLAP